MEWYVVSISSPMKRVIPQVFEMFRGITASYHEISADTFTFPQP